MVRQEDNGARLLSYLDEVSSVNLQSYNLFLYDLARKEKNLNLNDHHDFETFLFQRIKKEWSSEDLRVMN